MDIAAANRRTNLRAPLKQIKFSIDFAKLLKYISTVHAGGIYARSRANERAKAGARFEQPFPPLSLVDAVAHVSDRQPILARLRIFVPRFLT